MNKKILGSAVAAVIGMVGVFAYAQAVPSGGAPPRYLPYVGHLDHDGSPVTGKVAMKVCLVTNQATGCDAATWVEEFDSVDVAGGNFSLTLGQTTAIPDGIYNNAALYIRAMVGATAAQGTPTFVQLSGSQRVLSVPYAINVNQASDLHVDGPIHNGSVVPTGKEVGLFNETGGGALRLVTSGGAITMSVDGSSGNGYTPNYATSLPILSAQSNGVQIGASQPIHQITTCHRNTSTAAYDTVTVGWQAGDCSNGLPSGVCYGMLSRAADCGPASSWTVLVPGEDNANAPSGGIRWYNHDRCGAYDIGATYFCGN